MPIFINGTRTELLNELLRYYIMDDSSCKAESLLNVPSSQDSPVGHTSDDDQIRQWADAGGRAYQAWTTTSIERAEQLYLSAIRAMVGHLSSLNFDRCSSSPLNTDINPTKLYMRSVRGISLLCPSSMVVGMVSKSRKTLERPINFERETA